ncbi:hypothetical protein [Bradyrhizobium centrosematis]|uniref:hypothetical protein n=1 Tax=Bradyrhizobium centrosematis TaxID=1300039 RepID=UPI0035B59326
MTSPMAMTAIVVLKVGPVKVTFSGKVTLTDRCAERLPHRWRGRRRFCHGRCEGRLRGRNTGRHHPS